MTQTEISRSNRPLTEFACGFLARFLTGKYLGEGLEQRGNTLVRYKADPTFQDFSVSIFDDQIFSMSMVAWAPSLVTISFGNYYDDYGRPSTTTVERLNGLLNRLAMFRVIPDNVRIFRDPEHKLSYLGRFDEKIAVGKNYAKSIGIQSNPKKLILIGGELQ